MSISPGAADFFSTMRERHAIYLRRKAGLPAPWTDDPVMREYSITNPFRENDRTTRWLKDNVREGLRDKPEVLLAIAVFRWFNRIGTGEAVFCQQHITGDTAWDMFLASGDVRVLYDSIKQYCGSGPYVTGSYIIQGWRGMNKLDGVLRCIQEFYHGLWKTGPAMLEMFDYNYEANWREIGKTLLHHQYRGHIGLEQVWLWLRQIPYLGDFMAHEIVQDLRYTDLLCDAPDINTWSNPGPGAERGLARVYGRDITGNIVKRQKKGSLILEMCELLELSRSADYWPRVTQQKDGTYLLEGHADVFPVDKIGLSIPEQWPALELHQIEMWLCEFQKIMKARTGEGRPRGKFHSGRK